MNPGGRGFGLAPRSGRGGRGTTRTHPAGDRWISVHNTAPAVRETESLDGPMPAKREQVERKFNTYCAIHLGHPRNAAPKKVYLLRHLYNLIKMADDTAAIQPYLPDDKVNSICHATHISEKIKDFEHYFPEVKYYNNRIRTKCRLSTNIPIKTIKNKIWADLRKHDFWVEPTSIKCYETARCGFFLYAHPDFTHRHDFVKILSPILKQNISSNLELEFDFQPEKLTVQTGLKKISEKVVMLRSTPSHSEKVQSILTNLFSENDDRDIMSLRKYMFVPISIAGDNDKVTLQGLLKTQQNFRQNVYHYIVTNISNYEAQFPVTFLSNEDTTSDTDQHMQDATDTTEDKHPHNDRTCSQAEGEAQSHASTNDSTTLYSLREWMYDLQDDNGESLIHATYPSAETHKIFVLCEKTKAIKVLQMLHNLIEIAGQLFTDDALKTYFGPEQDLPLVHNHPRATAEMSTYANTLATYATVSNPQEEHSPISSSQDQRGPKRTRDGNVRTQLQTYAAAAGQQNNYGADVTGLMKQLESNLNTLKQVESKQQTQEATLEQVEQRFQRIEGGLEGHGRLLHTLSQTQTQQGRLLSRLNNKLDVLTHYATGKPGQPPDPEPEEEPNDHPDNEPNTSHGEPEGTGP